MSFQNCVEDCESKFKEAEAACKTLQKQLIQPCLVAVKAAFSACCKKCADELLAPAPAPGLGNPSALLPSSTTPAPVSVPLPIPGPPSPPIPAPPEYWAEIVQPGKSRLVHHGDKSSCFQINNHGGGKLMVIVDGQELEELSMGDTSACHCGKDIQVKAGAKLAAYTPIPCTVK